MRIVGEIIYLEIKVSLLNFCLIWPYHCFMKLDQALHQHSDFGYTQLNVALHFFFFFDVLFVI